MNLVSSLMVYYLDRNSVLRVCTRKTPDVMDWCEDIIVDMSLE